MSYFKINGNDYSAYVKELKVQKKVNYSSQTNASGNTVVDYQNTKRTIDVRIIPIDEKVMSALQCDIDKFNVQITFRNPQTKLLETVSCIIPQNLVEYYTIQATNVSFKECSLMFIEL